MIINNKKVQGLYIYNSDSESIEFTKNDLVVSGNSIYICDAESVSGIDPAEDTGYEYYRPYPGDKITTASEFFQYIESGIGGDKYVSSQAIMGILQGYQFGLNAEGVISDYIDKNGDTSLILSNITERPIDNLMLTETLNRGMIKISPLLKDINNMFSEDGTSLSNFSVIFGKVVENNLDYSILLNQYTYKFSDTDYMRIQEMMSPLTGVSVYRYMTWSAGSFPEDGNIISGWRNVYSYSSVIEQKLNTLQAYYENISKTIEAKTESIKGSFRFKECYSGGGLIVSGLEEGIYTVCLRGTKGNNYVSESVVVKLAGSNYSLYFNSIPGYLSITSSSIELKDSIGTEIISVYKREEVS